jgi:hypothetical protein
MTGSLPFWGRFALAAAVSPLIVAVILFITGTMAALAYGAEPWANWSPSIPAILGYWLMITAAVAAGGAILWKLGKVELRHHLLLALLIGAVPILSSLLDFLAVLSLSRDPGNASTVPYPCAELLRHETFDLPGAVEVAMFVSLLALAFKWLAYGFSRESATLVWKIAGTAYILVLALVMLEPFHYSYQGIPAWSNWVQQFCEYATD